MTEAQLAQLACIIGIMGFKPTKIWQNLMFFPTVKVYADRSTNLCMYVRSVGTWTSLSAISLVYILQDRL